MFALDPAMLSHSPPSREEDSDYEYEYHDSETETFFLNIDLTTQHGPIRPPRRRNDPSTPITSTTSSAPPSRNDDQEPAIASTEMDNVFAERVQILGLHTPNPIVSYHNQIFSGSWADHLGTELLFSRPEPRDPDSSKHAPIEPLRHTQDFDLIAANSVKILGRKANLITTSGPGPTHQVIDQSLQQQFSVPPGSSPPPLAPPFHTSSASQAASDPRSLVYKPEAQTNQARFLERLTSIKKAKGETDTVRTVFSFRRGGHLEERLRGWARTDEQMALIQRLNERALQGDSEAIVELENIYAQLGGQDPDPLSDGPSRPG